MGYLHIPNSYKDQTILLFRECFALEKVHGTSAHITWKRPAGAEFGQLTFFSGGEKHANFVKLFDEASLIARFADMGHEEVTVYGEAYGGGQQKQSWRYGPKLHFVAFDVKVGDAWLNVTNADKVCGHLGLEFVHYKRVSTDLTALDAERDAPSEQARRNGVEGDQPREGVVLRPIIEVSTNKSDRIICKHKRAAERETKTDRTVGDPAKLAVLAMADAIADEWVTPTRLEHVLDKLGPCQVEDTVKVINAMVEDVTREAEGEIVDSREARRAIGTATAKLFKKRFTDALEEKR